VAAPLDLAGKKLLVVGAGRTGVAVARFAAARGARVTVSDRKTPERIDETPLLSAVESIRFEMGAHRTETFTSADLIVISPGVPPTLPELVAAQQAGVPITGELELASRFIAAPIVAVTGTNGKSTVTALCGEIARATGRPTFIGGNFGTPLIEAVDTDAATQHGIIVCECSSFQLETVDTFRPRVAVLLNITPDHLDRYPSMTEYADAKLRLAKNLGAGDLFVLNEDDPAAVAAYERAVGGSLPTLPYSTRARPRPRFMQGLGDGVVSLEVGGFVEGGAAGETLVVRLPRVGRAQITVDEERYASNELQLVGRHNLGNALAAVLAMRGSGLADRGAVEKGARSFRPLPHRMQLVGERRGVRFYDDSKGTNVAAVVASIDGFPRPFILIAGGRDKGGSYAPLRDALQRNIVRGVVLIGEAADKIASAVEGVAPVHRASSMDEAVTVAARLALDGDAVVLSPACSSYDMFDDFEHRGRMFRAAVETLR
jgi:UDP-N-acetylmuramoylalanine--D-glutamate ligase